MNDRTRGKETVVGNPIDLERMPDALVFGVNKCSKKARKIVVVNHNLVVELWFDRHYYERHHFGDKNGKREGIDPEIVESFVTKSIGHLFFYSAVVKEFKFINYKVDSPIVNRIVLKEIVNGATLNVVIEVHYLSINQFEITVITAMVADNFRIAGGQFCLEVHKEHSILKKLDNGKLLIISSFQIV